jgi:hypothetical protein
MKFKCFDVQRFLPPFFIVLNLDFHNDVGHKYKAAGCLQEYDKRGLYFKSID